MGVDKDIILSEVKNRDHGILCAKSCSLGLVKLLELSFLDEAFRAVKLCDSPLGVTILISFVNFKATQSIGCRVHLASAFSESRA